MAEDAAPHFTIAVNGADLAPEVAVDVISVSVASHVSGADMFTLEVNNWNSDHQELKWVDTDQFAPGLEVEVRLGFVDTPASLIKGEITALEPEFHNDRAPTLKVQGYDRLHRFRRGRRTRSFIEMTDSAVASRIAQELSLQPQVEDTSVVHPYLLQNNQTNIDFLQERARRIRFEVDVVNKTLVFRAARNGRAGTLTLAFGDKLKRFFPRLTTVNQVEQVVVQGWNPKTKEAIVARARPGAEVGRMGGSTTGPAVATQVFGASEHRIVDKYLFSPEEADQIARAKFNEMAVGFITAEGTAIGNPAIVAGEVVELTKLGTRFSGLYYVTSATHAVKRDGYLTHFTVERNAI